MMRKLNTVLIKSFAFVLLIMLLGACSDTGVSTDASGDDYPNKPIEVIVPAGAGGDTDLNTRIMAKYLEEELGQSIVISNVAGAGGSTGINQLLSSKPDGYTVLSYHNAMLVNNIYGLDDYTYEDFKFAGIGIVDQSNTFLASKDAEFNDIESLIEYAKEHPGEVKVATEIGSMTHLQVLEFEAKADVKFNVVDVGGASDKITALLGGRVDIVPTSLGLVQDYLNSGDFVALGVIADERLEAVPDVETFKEQGIDMSIDKVFYWAFPLETPDEIVSKFSEAMKSVVENESFQEEIKNAWLEPQYLDPDQSVNKLQDIDDLYREVYEDSNKGEVSE